LRGKYFTYIKGNIVDIMLNFNLIGNVFKVFKKNGGVLVRREFGLDISKAEKEGIFKGLIPEDAFTYDAVRVGRKFKPKKHYTDIFSFRDKDGQLIKRVTQIKDGTSETEIVKKYIKDAGYWYDDADNVFDSTFLRIRGYKKENGQIKQCFDDMTSITERKKKVFTRFKRVIEPNAETVRLEERVAGKAPKFIESKYNLRYYEEFDELTPEQGLVAGLHTLETSEASSELLGRLARNTFLLPYLSPENKFIYRLGQAIEHEKGLDRRLIKDLYPIRLKAINETRPKTKDGKQLRGQYYERELTVKIWKKNPDGTNVSRDGLLTTMGHEYGHAKWYEMNYEYEMVRSGIMKMKECSMLKKKDLPTVKEHDATKRAYVNAFDDYEQYLKQLNEMLARKEGRITYSLFNSLSSRVEKAFKYLINLFIHNDYMYSADCCTSDSFSSMMSGIIDPLDFLKFINK